MFFEVITLPYTTASWAQLEKNGLVVLTAVAVVLFIVEVLYAQSDSPQGGSAPSSSEGRGPGSNPGAGGEDDDDDGGWGWKTKVLVGVAVTVGALMLGSYWGWSDPFYFVKHPAQFGGAVTDRVLSVVPGLPQVGPTEIRSHLVQNFPSVWAKTNSMDEFLRKTLEANVNPLELGTLTRRLTELGAHPEPIFRAVEAAYPDGASARILDRALQIAAADFIDCMILEHAQRFW